MCNPVDQIGAIAHDRPMTLAKSMRAWAIGAALLLSGCGGPSLDVWEQLRIVGSTSMTSFGEIAAEELQLRRTDLKQPIVEATGTGAGIEIFCGTIGGSSPDLTFASRRMKKEEHDLCLANGVKDSLEVPLAMDSLMLVQAKAGTITNLTRAELYRALTRTPFGRKNRATRWNMIDARFSAGPILIYGPPSTSGTHSAVSDLLLKPACMAEPAIAAMKDQAARKKICSMFRDDGGYVTVEEGSDLFLRKLVSNPQAIGIASLAFALRNADQLRMIAIDGVTPGVTSIQDGSYAGGRIVYAYVKRKHLKAVPGLPEYVKQLVAQSGQQATLERAGLVPLPADKQQEAQEIFRTSRPLDPAKLN